MLNLNELEQFVLFAEHGTLLKVSEITNISQPTLTRSMKHVEDAFGVSLFKRGKNRLELNKTGQKAIIYARQILDAEKNAIQAVKEFDQHLHLYGYFCQKYPRITRNTALFPEYAAFLPLFPHFVREMPASESCLLITSKKIGSFPPCFKT